MNFDFPALKEFLTWVFTQVSISTFILFLILTLGIYVAYRAQHRDDFDFADMLRDSRTGKAVGSRLAVLVSLAISSWLMVYAALQVKSEVYGQNIITIFSIFLGVWSGAKIVEKVIDAWVLIKGNLPTLVQPPPQPIPPKGSADEASTVESSEQESKQ